MAAMPQRRIEEESSTEVFYLVIPPGAAVAAPAPKPWTLVESAALFYWNVRHGVHASPVGVSMRAMGIVAGYAFIGVTLLVAGYVVKTAIGFDMVPGTHMGGYAPDIGGPMPRH